MKKQLPASIEGGNFNTLVQTGTTTSTNTPKARGKTVCGKGSDISDLKVKHGRMKRKFLSIKLIQELVKMAESENNQKYIKRFWNTYHCMNRIVESNGKIYGKYCKNRVCLLCLSNRKATLINEYLPILNSWEEPYFVTLTVKAVRAERLPYLIKNLLRGFQLILNGNSKKLARGKTETKLIGFRSMECEFNPAKRTYNPHFHIIVPTKAVADQLINYWIGKAKIKGLIKRTAQHSAKITNKEKALIEIIKYGSKIFTNPEVRKTIQGKKNPKIYLKALYTILKAFDGIRLFERFGFNTEAKNNGKTQELTYLENYKEFEYNITKADWVEIGNGYPLTSYEPTKELRHIIENHIDLELN
jgi:hypothetical protein